MKFFLISPKNRPSYNFRGDLIKEIIARGNTVDVTGPDMVDVDRITELGADFHEVPLDRYSTGIVGDLKYCARLAKLLKKEKADIVLGYTIKPVIFGSIAAKLAGVKNINAMITGGGYVFANNSKSVKARILKLIVSILYKIAFACANNVIFQNPDDMNEFLSLKLLKKSKCRLVAGSGVNMEKFKPSPYPEKVSFFMLSRLLKCKGVGEYLQAAEIVKKQFPEINFYLLGKIDSDPQDAIPSEVIYDYINRGIVQHFPETHDVRPYYDMTSVYVLPSYREGVPRTVLEAMAMARPIITTDTNGCRETVRDGVNGFLVPVRDVDALVEAMKKFIDNPELVGTMGKESLAYCSEKFDVRIVNENLCNYMKINK